MARKTINERTETILAALQQAGPGWHSRADLARLMSKNRLNAADAVILETLVAQGVVIAEQHEIDANIPQRWEYRLPDAKPKKAR